VDLAIVVQETAPMVPQYELLVKMKAVLLDRVYRDACLPWHTSTLDVCATGTGTRAALHCMHVPKRMRRCIDDSRVVQTFFKEGVYNICKQGPSSFPIAALRIYPTDVGP
jgi:hypothetical protein